VLSNPENWPITEAAQIVVTISCVLLKILLQRSRQRASVSTPPRRWLFLILLQTFQQLLPHNRYIVRCIRADPDLIACVSQYSDLDLFTGGQFNDDTFAWAAREYEHGNLLLPGFDYDTKTNADTTYEMKNRLSAATSTICF